MSVNVKLGNDTLTGVDTVQLENADSAGTYIDFTLGGDGIQGYNLTKSTTRGTIYYVKSDGTTGTATAQGTYSDVVFCVVKWGFDILINSGNAVAITTSDGIENVTTGWTSGDDVTFFLQSDLDISIASTG